MPGDTVLLEELTWIELADRIEDGFHTVLVPCGAIEQHGPHMPFGVDTHLGYSTAEAVARRLGHALVAPTIRPTCSHFHADFPGTISVDPSTFVDVLEAHCDAMADAGFEYIVLITTHGGNVDVMNTHVPYIARRIKPRAEVHFVRPSTSEEVDWDELGGSPIENGHHAGFGETSKMLADYPGLVDMDMAEEGMTLEEFYAAERETLSRYETLVYGMRSQAPNGIVGDARRANAEAGRTLKEMTVDAIVDAITRRIESEPLTVDLPNSVAHDYD